MTKPKPKPAPVAPTSNGQQRQTVLAVVVNTEVMSNLMGKINALPRALTSGMEPELQFIERLVPQEMVFQRTKPVPVPEPEQK